MKNSQESESEKEKVSEDIITRNLFHYDNRLKTYDSLGAFCIIY